MHELVAYLPLLIALYACYRALKAALTALFK